MLAFSNEKKYQLQLNERNCIHLKAGIRLRSSGISPVGIVPWKPGWLVDKSAGLVIERLRVRIPAGAAGELSSPEPTLCADSYSVSFSSPPYRSHT